MKLKNLFRQEKARQQALAEGCVTPETSRCVQCGICSYNCPIGIDVRRHAWESLAVNDSRCLTCGECVARCPRGVLRFERTSLFCPTEAPGSGKTSQRVPGSEITRPVYSGSAPLAGSPRQYVILGSGPAGIAAAEAIRSLDPAGRITLVSDEPEGYYSRPGLAYFLTGEMPAEGLFPYGEADFRRLRVERLHGRAERVEPGSHRVSLQNGESLPYDRLLIATGASAASLRAPGADLEGVVKLDNFADARRIHTLARRARRAVVVGGGITALELVEGLVSHKVKTHYFLRGERYWNNVLDELEARIIEQRLIEERVAIHFHTEIEEVLGDRRGRVTAVRTRDGRIYPCDLLAVAVGVLPRKELAAGAGLKLERGILVSEHMQTSDPDIYAAGDVAQVYDPLTGVSVLDSLWGPAREQGRTAGLNMAGVAAAYIKPVPFNVTRLARLTTTIIGRVGRGEDADLHGIARGDSETWRQLPDAIAAQANFEVNRLRLLVGKRSLLGAVVMGDQTLSQPLHRLVSKQVDISKVRDKWLQPGAPLADLVADFWTTARSEVLYA
jgi:NAD(P)H-nitrite reductase large subunit/Pyruvate/2-oxoacid:ferredoxin oxidoreductase delta subunit